MSSTVFTRPLRIALLGSSRFPISQPFAGGLEAHVWQLAHALTARGHHVTLFAAQGSSMGVASEVIALRTFTMSEIVRADPATPGWAVHEHHAYLSVMMDLAGPLRHSFDIVHNHSLHYLPVAMSSAIAAPMLTTLHTPPLWWLESAVAVQLNPGTEFAAVSKYTASQWDHIAGPVPVVLNGIDLDEWSMGPGGDYAVWTGRLVPEKGAELAIAAARRAGFALRIAGPISDRDYFDREIAPLLGSDVTYEGHLRQKELATLVGGAAVALITPRWEEPYGLVVAEALACGTPVAAFGRGGIPEIVDETCGRLAPPDDTAALAVAVSEAAALSRFAARARASAACSNERMIDTYLSIYREMCSRADAIGDSGLSA